MQTLDAPHTEARTRATYDATFRLVLHVLKALGVAPEDREDILQEAFLRFHTHAQRIAPHAEKAWLCAVARNLAIEAFRKRKRLSSVSVPEASPLEAPCDAALEPEEVVAFLRSVAVPHGLRFLEDFYLGQKDVRSIAAEHGLRVSSVTSGLCRQRRVFRSLWNTRAGAGSPN